MTEGVYTPDRNADRRPRHIRAAEQNFQQGFTLVLDARRRLAYYTQGASTLGIDYRRAEEVAQAFWHEFRARIRGFDGRGAAPPPAPAAPAPAAPERSAEQTARRRLEAARAVGAERVERNRAYRHARGLIVLDQEYYGAAALHDLLGVVTAEVYRWFRDTPPGRVEADAPGLRPYKQWDAETAAQVLRRVGYQVAVKVSVLDLVRDLPPGASADLHAALSRATTVTECAEAIARAIEQGREEVQTGVRHLAAARRAQAVVDLFA